MRGFGWVARDGSRRPRPSQRLRGRRGWPSRSDACSSRGTRTSSRRATPRPGPTHPFGAEIRDGRLYGRGSADMKSGLVAALFAARAVADDGPFPGRIVLAALVDEEGHDGRAPSHFVSTGRAERHRRRHLLRARGWRGLQRLQGRAAAPGRLHRRRWPTAPCPSQAATRTRCWPASSAADRRRRPPPGPASPRTRDLGQASTSPRRCCGPVSRPR